MPQVAIIGVDLAKRAFQLHGAAADGSVVFRKKLTRERFLPSLASQPPCVVAMEAAKPLTVGGARLNGSDTRCGSFPRST